MKKIAAAVLLIGIAGFPLYAQLSPGIGIGGWARYIIAPIGGTGNFGEPFSADNMYVRNQSNQNWLFPTRGKVGLAAWGNSDYVGFNFDVCYEDGAIRVGDQAKLWVRPHEIIMLHFGKIQGNKLRSEIKGGRLVYTEEENEIFTHFIPTMGMLVDLEPLENLYIGFSIDARRGSPSNSFVNSFKDVFGWESTQNGYQIGVGYRFNFGHLRAQFLANNGDIWTGKPIQAAFSFTQIYNLVIDAGILYPMKPETFSPAKATAAAEYKLDQWDLMGRATVVWYPESLNTGIRLKAGSVVKYTINFPLFVGAEIAYISDYQQFNQSRDNLPPLKGGEDLFQICPFVGFKYGRGEFRIGFHWVQSFKGDKNHFRFEFPLMLEVNFL